jgi:hypothetical protein
MQDVGIVKSLNYYLCNWDEINGSTEGVVGLLHGMVAR